jgi:hypothetical protein
VYVEPAGRPRTPHGTSATEHGDVGRSWRLGRLGSVRLHHRFDDDDRPEPEPTDPATAAALSRAARDVRMVTLIHLALLALGIGLFALALLLRVH